MRIAWRTVGAICERVVAEAQRGVDLLDGLRRIGIDEISHRKGQRYLTVVIDHDSGRLVWAAPGRDRKTVERFLDALGEERCKQIYLATDALDEIRRDVWNQARKAGEVAVAKDLKGARFALRKNPENLTGRQRGKLADVQKTNEPLYRGYLLKEQLRAVYRVPTEHAQDMLDAWLRWARRCRLEPFVKLAKTISAQRAGILAAITHASQTPVSSRSTRRSGCLRVAPSAFTHRGP